MAARAGGAVVCHAAARKRNGPTFASLAARRVLLQWGPMPASASRRGRVSEAIVHRIKKQITEGRLLAGHKLPAEREMARQFKTSRVSVREAYRSLEEVGVLRIRRGADGGAFVAQLDHQPVLRSLALVLGLGKTSHKELTEARIAIEPPIARLAALRARKEDIVRLEHV